MFIKRIALVSALLLLGAAGIKLFGHCQIPCGIYNDPARFTLLEEHATTIEKSMKQIVELSAAGEKNWNQITRWVLNKEKHADELSDIVTYYFMAQRIKPQDPADKEGHAKYVRELTLLHHMLVHAMKAKQTTDLENVEKLRSAIHDFKVSYLGEEAAEAHEHGGPDHK